MTELKGHEKEVYNLTQTALDLCGNTLEIVQDYCMENGLDPTKFEDIRFKALKEYGRKE